MKFYGDSEAIREGGDSSFRRAGNGAVVGKDKDEPQRGNGIIWAPLPVMGVMLATPVRGAVLAPVWCSKRASFGAVSGIQETSFSSILMMPLQASF